MTIELEENANEQSSYPIEFDCIDELGLAVVPNSITWKLTDDAGTVINNKSAETITPGSSFSVVIYGDDLKYEDGAIRKLLIQTPYDSSYGLTLPLNEEYSFNINDFITVS
jgi:hypothetical protein